MIDELSLHARGVRYVIQASALDISRAYPKRLASTLNVFAFCCRADDGTPDCTRLDSASHCSDVALAALDNLVYFLCRIFFHCVS